MTHSNHRQGTAESLRDDFVALAFTLGVPRDMAEDSRIHRWRELALGCGPTNLHRPHQWHHYTFDHPDKVTELLRRLRAAELGLSITITGLLDQVNECCLEAGLRPHTVNLSLGVGGRVERLPHPRLLEFTTMCGHGKVSHHLVWHLAQKVMRGAMPLTEAAVELARPCLCDLMNLSRTERLLKALVQDIEQGKVAAPAPPPPGRPLPRRQPGMTIDPRKCTGCLECVPYCPTSSIGVVAGEGVASINEAECVECGTCFRAGVCAPDAIIPQELPWPRSLRPDFTDPYVPACSPLFQKSAAPRPERRSLLTTLKSVRPPTLSTTHGDKTNDVTGEYPLGRSTLAVELGRPVLGTRLTEAETVLRAFLPLRVTFEEHHLVLRLLKDRGTGSLQNEVRGEKVHRCVICFSTPLSGLPRALEKLRQVAQQVDTVLSVNLISVVERDGSLPVAEIARREGFTVAPGGKTNVGLGRPLAPFPG